MDFGLRRAEHGIGGGGQTANKCIAKTGSDVGAEIEDEPPARTGVSTHVDAMDGVGPKLGAEVGNRRELGFSFGLQLMLRLKLTLELKLWLGVKGGAWVRIGVRLGWDLKLGLELERDGAEFESQFVTEDWLPYFNPNPAKGIESKISTQSLDLQAAPYVSFHSVPPETNTPLSLLSLTPSLSPWSHLHPQPSLPVQILKAVILWFVVQQ